MKKRYKNYKKKVEKHFKEVLKIKASPHSIALGFAIGTAIALLPTFGLGVLIGLGILLIFKKISKVSMLFAFLIWNIFVLYPLYGLAYKIGDWILGDVAVQTYSIRFLGEFFAYSRRFLLGNLIITITFTLISYLIIYIIAIKYQKQYKKTIKEPVEEAIEKAIGEDLR